MLRGRTRVLSACQRCRKQKIKCTGSRPCRTCLRRGLMCEFGAEDKQVIISEKELFDLRNRPRRSREAHSRTPSTPIQEHPRPREPVVRNTVRIDRDPPTQSSVSENIRHDSHASSSSQILDTADGIGRVDVANPLVPERPAYISDMTGKLRYLGHSSSYAFTQQVLHMLYQSPSSNPSPEVLLSSGGRTYNAESDRLMPFVSPDVSKLPSKSAAIHYLQCVSFRTNPLFYLFDNTEFVLHLQLFYATPFEYAQSAPVWYVHYLVLMSLGKALDPYGRMGDSADLTVCPLFTRALQSLPDMSFLCGDDPVEATELFCCITLYLQSIDHRRAAIVYIGQALRMAQLHALHLDLDENVVGTAGVKRGRRVWWTVYALNQKLTSNLGLPSVVDDRDIRSPLTSASENDEDSTAIAIHVKICQLLGTLINRVYSSSDEYQKSFASTARTVLTGAARVADEVKQYSEKCFGEISRTAAHLELAFHQCIILTCRPALFYLVKLRSSHRLDSNEVHVPPSLTGLIQACVDSATQAVQILSQLRNHNLLDTFLPFDLECGFSAAFVLVMAGQLNPKVIAQDSSVEAIKSVFSTMSNWGNVQADLRRMEIEQLDQLLRNQTQMIRGSRTMVEPGSDESGTEFAASQLDIQSLPQLSAPFFSEWTFDAGLSGDQFMDLADALDARDFGSISYWPSHDSFS